ncbi:PREDICTED: clathrin light chain 2 [Tarenaya hassleriana]|uniref:clathrin light chain 2 n=1 Tax=Tarenaya hassleriana TaxID=28532 RepID=UPI00053C8E25|nr:PREDICTED: clathrin light chain 2 [Tarenaya hassleriana]
MSASDDSFVILGDDSSESAPVISSFDATESFFSGYDDSSVPVQSSADDVFTAPSPDYGGYSNGDGFFGSNGGSDGPVLPPPSEMESEEGFAIREWRRQNATKLEEKEKREKEMLSQIIEEANQYKAEFYKKREVTCENNKADNREKEKHLLASQEKFYAEADKNYWKAIAELIPKEVAQIEKRRGKKDQEKKASIAVIQGPKPGKPTDLARMRQIVVKLKQNPPPHLRLTSQPAPEASATAKNVPELKSIEAIVAA